MSEPTTTGTVEEIRGVFPNDAALQDAIARLQVLGFDRADLSVPSVHPAPGEATPELGAENPNTEADARQSRTLHSSMAASVGALAAAGAVIATGGAALPAVAAAVAGGVALGGAAEGVTRAIDGVQQDGRDAAAERGELVLSVRVSKPGTRPAAEAAMREAGASLVASMTRSVAGQV